MTIFVSIMLVFFSLWMSVGIWAVYDFMTMSEFEKDVRTLQGLSNEIDLSKASHLVIPPFIGIAACIGYLFG